MPMIFRKTTQRDYATLAKTEPGYKKYNQIIFKQDGDLSSKDSNIISRHPMIIGEIEGTNIIIIATLTSSSEVNGEKTVEVGIKQDGNSSYLVHKNVLFFETEKFKGVKVKLKLEDMKMENCENVLGKCVKALEEEHGIKIKNPK
jgi:hypothetical protein